MVSSLTATNTTATLSWQATVGHAFAVESYIIQISEDSGASFTTVQCSGGQYPPRTDGGSTADADWFVGVTSRNTHPTHAHPTLLSLSHCLISHIAGLSYTVSGLAPYTLYVFVVRAYTQLDGGTFSAASVAVNITTDQSSRFLHGGIRQ